MSDLHKIIHLMASACIYISCVYFLKINTRQRMDHKLTVLVGLQRFYNSIGKGFRRFVDYFLQSKPP